MEIKLRSNNDHVTYYEKKDKSKLKHMQL